MPKESTLASCVQRVQDCVSVLFDNPAIAAPVTSVLFERQIPTLTIIMCITIRVSHYPLRGRVYGRSLVFCPVSRPFVLSWCKLMICSSIDYSIECGRLGK